MNFFYLTSIHPRITFIPKIKRDTAMARHESPFRLMKREKYYYYKLPHEKTYHSTGKTSKAEAREYVIDFLNNSGASATKDTLRKFAKDFYIFDKCFHVQRLLKEGKIIGRNHCRNRRLLLEKYVFSDGLIADKELSRIRRGDLLDYRERLESKGISKSTINGIMGTLKTVFSEAEFREQINRNPLLGIGNLKYQPKEIGIFTEEELLKIFPKEGLGPWVSLVDYTCFLLTALTGMRRGEVLALQWFDIDFQKRFLTIRRAWKSRIEIGLPKWEKKRIVPLPLIVIEKLKELRERIINEKLKNSQYDFLNNLPDRLVFSYSDGGRLGDTWWRKRFKRAMENIGINYEERNLTPHSLRHTLNSILKSKGYNPEMIRASLGWADEKIQDNYTHWKPEHLIEQSKIIENIWNKK